MSRVLIESSAVRCRTQHIVTDCKVLYAYTGRLIDVPDFLLLEQTFTGINSAVSNKSTLYINNSLKIKTHYTLHKCTIKAARTFHPCCYFSV